MNRRLVKVFRSNLNRPITVAAASSKCRDPNVKPFGFALRLRNLWADCLPYRIGALGFGCIWLLLVEPVWAQVASEPVTGVDKSVIVDCKLPPQVRKFSSSTTTQVPGGVVKRSRIECESQGGMYAEPTVSHTSPTQGKHESVVTRALPSKVRVMNAQNKLKGLGFDPGTPDGIMGAKTIAALQRFQSERHLPSTGDLDEATALELTK